jgi:8-oxo-dGTP diphosphatase
MAYRTRVTGGEFKLNDHEEMAWATVKDLDDVVFAPADLPFVEMIRKGAIAIGGT